MTASTAASGALVAILLFGAVINAAPERSWCEWGAQLQLQSGWVCGTLRSDSAGRVYASFRGVPYAKQPLGELRFQELQPLEPWTGVFNATVEGPVCPQTDVVYNGIQTHAGGMSEACIHANVHLPLEALSLAKDENAEGLPIFVFVHGGGFAFGSGDADLHGPEYLVSKGAIVITFNYRLNVFGFLSLDSEQVPGNNGLRDCIALLRWVRDNAALFGGNPDDVTLAGQSAGASIAHLLTLSPAAEGLFKRVALFSGTGNAEFFSTSPVSAKVAAGLFLAKLGIPPTLDSDEVHRRLVQAPLESLMAAHTELLDLFGLMVFTPVVESQHNDVTPVLSDDPDVLIDRGCGSDIPHLIGFSSSECETFRPRFTSFNTEAKIAAMPSLLVTPKLTYQTVPAAQVVLVKLIEARYFNATKTLEDFIDYCSDAYYKYPAIKLAERRMFLGGAPTYLYRFSYGGRHSPIKEAMHLNFKGAGHIEDITYVFRANSVLGPLRERELSAGDDGEMKRRMTDYIYSFMLNSAPSSTGWSAVRPPKLTLQDIASPREHSQQALEPALSSMAQFFDGLYYIARGE